MEEQVLNTELEGMEVVETTGSKGSVLGAIAVTGLIIGAGVLLVKGTKVLVKKIKAAKAAKATGTVVVEEATEVEA